MDVNLESMEVIFTNKKVKKSIKLNPSFND
jgi:hypothetical protein